LVLAHLALLRLVVFVLIAASVLVTGAQQLGSDGPWWLELSRYLPFPITLAPALVALLLSLRLGRRWIAASAAAVLLFVTVAMGFVWHGAGSADGTVRVMTYNTKAAQLLERTGGHPVVSVAFDLHPEEFATAPARASQAPHGVKLLLNVGAAGVARFSRRRNDAARRSARGRRCVRRRARTSRAGARRARACTRTCHGR